MSQGSQKPDWYRQTEKWLRRKRDLPTEISNLELQIKLDRLAGPSIISQYSPALKSSTGSTSSPTEKAVISYSNREQRLERMQLRLAILENTIKGLQPKEYELYYLRYELELPNKEVHGKMSLERSAYYELQTQVVMKCARLMGIEIPTDGQPEEWKGKLFEGTRLFSD